MLVSRGHFSHAGAKLHFSRYGVGSPVVLIHGLSGSARWWGHNIPALRKRHAVYVVELAGYGAARRQRALGVQDAAALVAQWLRAENLRGVTLIGHSMGGHIAMHVAAQEPERVQGLVLACASGLLKASVYRTALHLPRAAVASRKRFLPQILFDAARAGPLNLWRSTVDLLKDSVQDILPLIRARTLVIWGERDALVPVRLGQLLGAAIPGAQVQVIPRAGHVVMVDAPQRFNALVLEFLNDLAQTGSAITETAAP